MPHVSTRLGILIIESVGSWMQPYFRHGYKALGCNGRCRRFFMPSATSPYVSNSVDYSQLRYIPDRLYGNGDGSGTEEGDSVEHLFGNRLDKNGTGGDLGYLLVALGIVSIPLVALSVLFIVLILHYRIQHNHITSPNLRTIETSDPGVYYTTISSTKFVLLASYSSTFAHVMIGFLMTFVSYPVSQRVLKHSKSRTLQNLPTPLQLAL